MLWAHKCSHFRLFGTLSLGVFLCLCLSSVLDRWTVRSIVPGRSPRIVNKPWLNCIDNSIQSPDEEDHCWRVEYQNRVELVRDTCNSDVTLSSRRSWRARSNRRLGKNTYCSTNLCPIIASEQNILFCFIPKVASSNVKRFFLNISNIPINDTLTNNAMHEVANDVLQRVSPMYYPATRFDHFYKIIFVRHPFDRLVSAFRNKAERSREEASYFYAKYWDPMMKKLRPRGSVLDRITFKEFVWNLINSNPRSYDRHWAPFWSRCNPCLVDYDFIGKLETADRDFAYAFRQAGIEFSSGWWNGLQPTDRSTTLRYFESVPSDMVRSLYEIFKLDFDLFGYSVQEFLPGNFTQS